MVAALSYILWFVAIPPVAPAAAAPPVGVSPAHRRSDAAALPATTRGRGTVQFRAFNQGDPAAAQLTIEGEVAGAEGAMR